MDCEKFDRVVLDLLYEELDELTAAAARRHMEHCVRCGQIGGGLRATREVGELPQEDPPPALFETIIQAERNAQSALSFRQRLGRSISVMAGYAMRPQLAMAAVLLLMIGLSLLLLHVRPTETKLAAYERGVPEIEGDPLGAPAGPPIRDTASRSQVAEGKEANPSIASDTISSPASPSEPFAAAASEYRAGRYGESQRRFEEIAQGAGPEAKAARYWVAQSIRRAKGCGNALPLFEAIRDGQPGTGLGQDAAWQVAECQRGLGDRTAARRAYAELLSVPAYQERARQALATLGADSSSLHVAARRAAPASREKAASTARAAPARPAASAVPGGPGQPDQVIGY